MVDAPLKLTLISPKILRQGIFPLFLNVLSRPRWMSSYVWSNNMPTSIKDTGLKAFNQIKSIGNFNY